MILNKFLMRIKFNKLINKINNSLMIMYGY